MLDDLSCVSCRRNMVHSSGDARIRTHPRRGSRDHRRENLGKKEPLYAISQVLGFPEIIISTVKFSAFQYFFSSRPTFIYDLEISSPPPTGYGPGFSFHGELEVSLCNSKVSHYQQVRVLFYLRFVLFL